MLQKDFDPRHHLHRELTNECVSLLFSGLRKAAPDACIHPSVCLESDVDMPANVMEAAIEFMSSQDRTNKPAEETGPVFLQSMQLNTAQRNMVENALQANSQMMSGLHKDVGVLLHRRARRIQKVWPFC